MPSCRPQPGPIRSDSGHMASFTCGRLVWGYVGHEGDKAKSCFDFPYVEVIWKDVWLMEMYHFTHICMCVHACMCAHMGMGMYTMCVENREQASRVLSLLPCGFQGLNWLSGLAANTFLVLYSLLLQRWDNHDQMIRWLTSDVSIGDDRERPW